MLSSIAGAAKVVELIAQANSDTKPRAAPGVVSDNHYSARWSWRVTGPAILAISVLIAAYSPSATLEGWWTDQKFALLPRVIPSQPDPVVLVGITERSFSAIDLPFGLWHHALADAFDQLAEAEPSIVVLDLELPARDYAANPGGMQRLAESISHLRSKSKGLMAGRATDPDGKLNSVDPLIEAVVGPDNFGLMLWRPDGDGKIRRLRAPTEGAPPTLVDAARSALGLPLQAGVVNYRIGAKFELIDIAEFWAKEPAKRAAAQARVRGKMVVLGMATAFDDRVPQPINMLANDTRATPLGMLLYAQSLRAASEGRLIRHSAWWGIVLAAIVTLFSFGFVDSVRSFTAFTFTALGVVLAITAGFTLTDLQLDFLPSALFLQIALPLVTTRHLVLMMRERNRLQHTFEGYVSPPMLEAIAKSELATLGATKRCHVGVMFVDIRGFTVDSLTRSPEEIVTRLNRYFSVLASAVHANSGTIDKFRGDGMMAYFGAPLPVGDPCAAALRATLAIIDAVGALNAVLVAEGEVPIEIGIGVADGEVIVGKVGSRERFDFTIIGEPANLAAHLQDHTKVAQVPVLIERKSFDAATLTDSERARFSDFGGVTMPKHGLLSLVTVRKASTPS